jgi:uncharacterized protein
MTLSGNHIVNASAQAIWNILMDPDALARVTPSITSLERIDADNFKAIAQVKMGPVNGTFTGTLNVSNREEPISFTLTIQQNSKIGNVSAVVDMRLASLWATQTEVSFNGDVKLTGTLSTMGERVITPVASTLAKQFFKDLEAEVVKG